LMRDLYVIGPVVGKQLDYAYLEKARMIRRLHEPGAAPAQAAYRGVPGSWSHKACQQFFGGDLPLKECSSFREVFDSVDGGQAAFGVLPLENSLTGSFHENYDLLLDYDLQIVGEVTLRIKHNLIGHPGAALEGIERIYSHPQVFQQCKEFVAGHPRWDHIACQNTAACVARVKENKDPKEAAIAGEEAAELHQLAVLKEGIEMNPRNFTRFVVISKSSALPGEKNKSSLIFSVGDHPGALVAPLQVFAANNINLVKLESRPRPDRPWEYLFYVDVELDMLAAENKGLLDQLREKTEFFKSLGSYQKGGAAAAPASEAVIGETG